MCGYDKLLNGGYANLLAKHKICVVTGSRAEYGLLSNLIKMIHERHELQLVATGMHLSPEFGSTVQEIESAGIPITWRVEMLLSSDSYVGMAKSVGLGLASFAECFAQLKPDMVVVLGDRFEIFSAVQAAFFLRIPIAHICGGELTLGAIDDGIRHGMTKLSSLHFATHETYRRRIIQLGEQPETVFNVGSISADGIRTLPLMNRMELEGQLRLSLTKPFLLVTYHPATQESSDIDFEMQQVFSALDALSDFTIIFTLPNADPAGRHIAQLITNYCHQRSQAYSFSSLGRLRYLSLMTYCTAVVGNSSSGLAEAPVLGKPTVNIGNRQEGRLRHSTVIDTLCERESIKAAILQAVSQEMKKDTPTAHVDGFNAFDGKASERIIDILQTKLKEGVNSKKTFYDLSSN
jgi:GDP/UDP-N,N'-diacetylbacillosamine 2-epimerase (hydrolysing)